MKVNILDYIDKMQVMYGDKDPSSMAQEPRNMFADGQLVQPSGDGSRPGYSGLGKDYKGNADFITIDGTKYRKISNKNNPNLGKFSFTERKDGKAKQIYLTEKQLKERVKNRYKDRGGWSQYGANATDDMKEYSKKYYEDNKKEEVKTEAGKLAKERDLKFKNFIGKKKKIKASVLKDFVLNDIGYPKYDSAKIKEKFPNLIIEKDLKMGSDFEPLTKQQKTLIKESFDLPEGVEDWNFKKHKYGISSGEHMNLAKQMERRLGGKQKYTLAASFDKPQGWMMGAMERVYKNETTLLEDGTRVLKKGVKKLTYEPVQKKGLIVGFKDNTVAGDGKTYYGTKKNAREFGDGTEWRAHGDFKKIGKFIEIANGVKAQPDEILQKILNKKGINIQGLTLNDVLSHQRYYGTLAKTSPRALIKRQIVLHHTGGVGDKILARAAATKDIQLLSGAVNAEVVNLENIVKGSSKEPGRKLTSAEKLDLKKLGAKITDFDGKVVGGGSLVAEKQYSAIEKDALKYAKGDQFNVKTVASYLERLGCGKAAGGRILMSNGGATLTKCAKAGQQKLTKGLTNGFGSKTEGELAKRILQAGKGLKNMVALRNILGPAAIGFTVAAEAGLVGYDMLATGKSFKEAVGASLFNYALGDKTKIDNKKLRYQGYKDAGVSANQIGKISAYENAIDEMNNTFAEFDEENRLYNIAANQKGRGRISEQRYKKLKQQQAENFYNQADKNKALIQDLARTQTESRLDKALDPMVPALMSDADAKRKAMQMTKPSTVKFGNVMDTIFPSGFFSDTTYREDRDKAVNYMPEVQEYYRGNRFARGGLSGGDTSGPPPESGPMSQGLRSLYKNGRKL
jgi:hypothetical protein